MARLNKGIIKDPFKALLLLKSTYKNWTGIIAAYFFRRSLDRAVLRDGYEIPLERKPSSLMSSLRHYHRWYDPSIYNLIGLARLLSKGWKIAGVQDEYLLLRLEPSTIVKCRINKGTDISLLGEIFIREVYGTDFQEKVVVDVGAYTGDSAIYFARKGAKLVIGLEPDPKSYELAKENVKLNHLTDRVQLLNQALSVETGESRLGLDANTPNINQFVDSGKGSENVIDVTTVTVDDIKKRFGLADIDVLKLNCEGCEYGIIRNLSAETLRSIGEILLEFHSGPRDLPAILSKNGFDTSIRGGTFGYLTAKRAK